MKTKTNTEMNALKTTLVSPEPTHDEIAMCAFLAWEKEGRPAGRETNYWLAAEAELRALRQKKAEAAAALAAKAALPKTPKFVLPVKSKIVLKSKAATTKTTSTRATTVAPNKPAPQPVRRTTLALTERTRAGAR